MTIGRFYAGIAALIWSPGTRRYLLLRRSEQKDYAPGVWECVTGRVDQGEGFEDALRREVREELGVDVQAEYILGTTHFYRGNPTPEKELVGVIYLCSWIKTQLHPGRQGTLRVSLALGLSGHGIVIDLRPHHAMGQKG